MELEQCAKQFPGDLFWVHSNHLFQTLPFVSNDRRTASASLIFLCSQYQPKELAMLKKSLLSMLISGVMLLASCSTVHAKEPITPSVSLITQPAPNQKQSPGPVEGMIVEIAEAHGIPQQAFLRMGRIESGLNPKAFHPESKACGLFQFIPSTARHYRLSNCFDPRANTLAAAALWTDNARALTACVGRAPVSGELYLAHQQGSIGACRLLANPEKLAKDIVGRKAVVMNGGSDGMTAAKFSDLWISRFRGL
ncbi:MAG: transglycosylase SLT domain-containing protein [Rhizobiaceae bacterium]|nr:transglycosylase SLT domain-containing protein [Rhizobiaceae bacterium]